MEPCVATVWKTKQLKERYGMTFRAFWKPAPVRAALLSARVVLQ